MVHAGDIEFTECSKLMEAVASVDATEQPDVNSAVITTFEQGTPVLVTGESEAGWYRITFQGQEGYVRMDAVKMAVQVEGESLEELDRELDEMEQTNRIILEEVERMRTEQKRSMIWTVIIIILVISIFVVGIYSTIKASSKDAEDAEAGEKTKRRINEEDISDIYLPDEKSSIVQKKLDIIDLDTTDLNDNNDIEKSDER